MNYRSRPNNSSSVYFFPVSKLILFRIRCSDSIVTLSGLFSALAMVLLESSEILATFAFVNPSSCLILAKGKLSLFVMTCRDMSELTSSYQYLIA